MRIVGMQIAGYGNQYIPKKRHEGNGAAGGESEDMTRISPKQIRDSVDASLRRLNTDYIDLLQVGDSCKLACFKHYVIQIAGSHSHAQRGREGWERGRERGDWLFQNIGSQWGVSRMT